MQKNSSDKTPTLWDLFLKTHVSKGNPERLVSTQAEQFAVSYVMKIETHILFSFMDAETGKSNVRLLYITFTFSLTGKR